MTHTFTKIYLGLSLLEKVAIDRCLFLSWIYSYIPVSRVNISLLAKLYPALSALETG